MRIRPEGTSAAEYPGTAHPAAKGMCGTCYKRQARHLLRPLAEREAEQRAKEAAICEDNASLTAYMNARRQRIARNNRLVTR